MAAKINTHLTGLTILRITSLIVAAVSIFGFITALGLFGAGSDFISSSEQKYAEGDTESVDALGGIIAYGIGAVWLGVSVIIFCLALLTYFITTKKLKKRASAVSQLTATETTQPSQTVEPQATMQVSETAINPKEDAQG